MKTPEQISLIGVIQQMREKITGHKNTRRLEDTDLFDKNEQELRNLRNSLIEHYNEAVERDIEHYFKYIVPNHYEEEYDTLAGAKHRATILHEKVYLCIFSKRNSYNEVYDEEIITKDSNIAEIKENLIRSFNNLTK